MKALITGASSGIGKDMSIILSKMGYDLILVSRNMKELENVQKILTGNSKLIALDLSDSDNCKNLYDQVKDDNIDILINNAGFGVYGEFDKTDINRELDMLDVNVRAVHILTKLFVQDMIKKDSGYILNVSSMAAFLPGPLMASYYASKAYVLRLTQSIQGELIHKKSKVYVGALCPGPVDTNFNSVAGVEFGVPSLSSDKVAMHAIKMMFKRKKIIVPGFYTKFSTFFIKFIPNNLLLQISYSIQKKKVDKNEK